MINQASQFEILIDDIKDWLSRAWHDKLHLPPERLRNVGDVDFEAIGNAFLEFFIELGGLKPNEHVLDIGCGIGRMAIPLTQYLTRGSYTGIDIDKPSIDWCRRNISPAYSQFKFDYADIYNKSYNRHGIFRDANYTFPYKDSTFDFIFLTSVFTHMLPDGVENYLKEICRMLTANGRVFMTFFILNTEQYELALQGKNTVDFMHSEGEYSVIDKQAPERAIAYGDSYIQDLIDSCGLSVSQPVYYGFWSGRTECVTFQDIILATRKT